MKRVPRGRHIKEFLEEAMKLVTEGGLSRATMATISIITASYNAAATISDCLESAYAQSDAAEHLLIDSTSTP